MRHQYQEKSGGISLERADQIPILPVLWLWTGWLAVGKLHILAGPPGVGKTMIALHTAAVLSRAGCWPDGSRAPLGRTIIWTGEDSVESTILPRLVAAGADMANVYILRAQTQDGYDRRFSPLEDLEQLRECILRLGDVKLIILDSIMQVASGEKNNQVRQCLEPLVGIADEFGIAILGISHTNKGSSKKNPVDRVTGTLAFTAVARIVWLVDSARPLEEGRQSSWGVLVRAKSNLGPSDGGFCYEIPPALADGSAAITWHLPMLEGTAKDVLQEVQGEKAVESQSMLKAAEGFLLENLGQRPWTRIELEGYAIACGISSATLRRARDSLGVSSKKERQPDGRVANVWRLPDRVSRQPAFVPPSAQQTPSLRQHTIGAPMPSPNGLDAITWQGRRSFSRFDVQQPIQPSVAAQSSVSPLPNVEPEVIDLSLGESEEESYEEVLNRTTLADLVCKKFRT